MVRKKVNKRNWVGLNCYYIGNIKGSIILYDGIITQDLGEKVKCDFVDRNINKTDDIFMMTLSKKLIKLTK